MKAVRARRGLTLIELAMVFALITILTAISVAALNGLKSRATFNATANEVVSMVRKTRIEALNRGTYTIFVINRNNPTAPVSFPNQSYWSIQTDQPITTPAELSTWLTAFASDPTGTCTGLPGCAILQNGTLPGSPTASFAGNYGAALPAPFANFANASTNSCTFCNSTPSLWGAVMFSPGGGVVYSTPPTSGAGAHFTLTGTRDVVVARTKTIAIVARTGLVEAYDK